MRHAGSRWTRPGWESAVHGELPVVVSPGVLPTQHIVTAADGATSLFLGKQCLHPAERVRCHTHRGEEVMSVISGQGAGMIIGDPVSLTAGTTLSVPAEAAHNFWCAGACPHQIMMIFSEPELAETAMLSEETGESTVKEQSWVAGTLRRPR